MFDLYFINSKYSWEYYCTKQEIQEIYKSIENLNQLGTISHYRIDINDRIFAFIDNSEYQLNFMRNHYNTNEKCKPRYTSDGYGRGLEKNKVKTLKN